jgi:DNA-binding transcriptional LysR family regulator
MIEKYCSIFENMQTDLNALVIFATVVECNGFSAAAKKLGMPVATVSRRVADLERDLGGPLLVRSTRSLRLTDFGTKVLDFAQKGAEMASEIASIATDHASGTSGHLRIAAPPSISDSLLAPVIRAFQREYPEIRIEAFITERVLDFVIDAVDLTFRVGAIEDSRAVARRILTYRHQLVASPAYLKKAGTPKTPDDLLKHRLLAFSFWRPQYSWQLFRADGKEERILEFDPYLAMNELIGLSCALRDGVGIGMLPPIVQPDLLRKGLLVEVMPNWRLETFHLSIVHPGHRYISKPARLFKDFAADCIPKLFPNLPK